jgi:hypothetical protein
LHKQEALPLLRRLRVAGVRAPEVADKLAAAKGRAVFLSGELGPED